MLVTARTPPSEAWRKGASGWYWVTVTPPTWTAATLAGSLTATTGAHPTRAGRWRNLLKSVTWRISLGFVQKQPVWHNEEAWSRRGPVGEHPWRWDGHLVRADQWGWRAGQGKMRLWAPLYSAYLQDGAENCCLWREAVAGGPGGLLALGPSQVWKVAENIQR